MSDDSPSGKLTVVISAGVILVTALVLWSSGQLFDFGWSSKPAAAKPPPVRPAVEPEKDERGSVADTPVTLPMTETKSVMEKLLEKIRAMLRKGHAVPNEMVLTFKTRAELTDFVRNASLYGLKIVTTLNALNAVRVSFADDATLATYLAGLGDRAPSFEPNLWMTVPTLPKHDATNEGGNVPVGDKLLASVNALGDRSHWGDGVTVAVLDTGVKAHPTFGENQIEHVDLVNDGKVFHSHGTSVASLIGGQDEQVPGISPATHLLDIRVANDKGISVSSVLAQGIVEAVDRHAQIINVSLGGTESSPLLAQAVDYAVSRKVFVVAAAGNDGVNQLAFPAAMPEVVSIGAVDGALKQATFSNSGSNLRFSAPGVGLDTAWDTDKVALVSGTSQATAVVSGVIAANYSKGISYDQMLRQMQADAKATGAAPDKVGSGVVQVTGKK